MFADNLAEWIWVCSWMCRVWFCVEKSFPTIFSITAAVVGVCP